MATVLQRVFALTPQKSLSFGVGWTQQSVRWAAKGGNKPCHQRKPRKGKNYGWKKRSGEEAHRGDMLVKQRVMRFHPGLNVEFGAKKHSLYAAVDGKVLVTMEKVSPRWDNPRVQEFYAGQSTEALHKKYYHVIPPAQPQKFKLVEQV